MAEPISAWGIDIGQAGLKAIKLRVSGDGERVVAAAFDYIPHPKILSQPDAIPEELIREAMKTFLERNKLNNDLIAISVPGQTSLAKFIKLPPVESSKVAEIVKYEARQQIPFDLNDVIWDYQPIGGGVEESGFMLEAEVGLFAMKRDLVFDAMKPFTNNGKEIELVQMAPLALYNFLSYDVLGFRKTAETPEPPAGEDYYVILDMGADNTTLLVSNGRSIWIRNVPIGGNHFTRALTREMKLTFAKAEHLKCNATKAPDPKAVFQAMRPVFNDYVSEIQRSIGYFGSVNRSAKIRKIVGVGNGFRLAGLQKFLQQNLQYEVERLESLNGVSGDTVLTDPLFIDNMMTFAVPYGLALQAIGKTRIRTSLLPPEIVVERKIRSKKPWAIAAAAGLLLTMGISTMGSASVLKSYSLSKWEDEQKLVDQVQSEIGAQKSAFGSEEGTHTTILGSIDQLVAPLQKRSLWMELFKAVNECLPYDEGDALDQADITLQKKLRITSISAKKVEDVAAWHQKFVDAEKVEDFAELDRTALTKKGYIVTLKGHHYFNNKEKHDFSEIDKRFVEKTLVANLRQYTLNSGGLEVPIGKIGISHPVVAWSLLEQEKYDPNLRIGSQMTGMGGGGMMPGGMMPGMMSGGEGYGGGEGYAGGPGADTAMGPGAMMPGSEAMPPGTGYPGGMPPGGGQTPGGKGPIFRKAEKQAVKIVDRTDFIVQFVWVPTIERQRKEVDPRAPAPGESTGDAATEAVETPAP
ncbi:MAG: type IV pilus assembly protein PilM [Planctomycetota bacterium]|nr:MAG: type IV pilus assembly protein PilM [Planctomycetota bacterium]